MNDQTKTYAMYGVAALLALQVLGGLNAGSPKTPDVPTPAVVQSGPSAEMRTLVAPVAALRAKNPEAATKTAALYRSAADVVRRDDSKIKTTGQFRTSKIAADALYAAKTPLVGALGSGPAVDAAIAGAIGLEDVPLDATKRARLAEVLDAIAWALEGGA